MYAAAMICAMVLALAYLLGHRLERFAESLGHRRCMSFAAGVSIAYVFVDVMPELSERNQAVVEIVGRHPLFGEQRIYSLALLAFVVLYGLDHFVSIRKQGSAGVATRPFDIAKILQIIGFAIYNWLIGYLLVERAEKGNGALAVYTAAMGLHFMIVDHSLREKCGVAYVRFGSWFLAISVPMGCAAAYLLPISETTFARLFACVAGGMLITSAQAELPTEREGRFYPFCVGAIAYAILLLAT